MTKGDSPVNTDDIKFVTVLNKSIETGRAINAGLHAALGLAAKIRSTHEDAAGWFDFRNFQDGDGGAHDFVSGRSLIVLQGKPGELRKLREQFLTGGVLFVDFHGHMTQGSTEDQLHRSAATPERDLEYFALAFVGHRSIIDPLTKRLSLWRSKGTTDEPA